MELTITIPEAFIPELLQNPPEYAVSFDCTKWDYEKNEFNLLDHEDGESYLLTIPKAEKGFKILMGKIFAGELPGLSISSANFLDAGN